MDNDAAQQRKIELLTGLSNRCALRPLSVPKSSNCLINMKSAQLPKAINSVIQKVVQRRSTWLHFTCNHPFNSPGWSAPCALSYVTDLYNVLFLTVRLYQPDFAKYWAELTISKIRLRRQLCVRFRGNFQRCNVSKCQCPDISWMRRRGCQRSRYLGDWQQSES